jgi:hypothetical protein
VAISSDPLAPVKSAPQYKPLPNVKEFSSMNNIMQHAFNVADLAAKTSQKTLATIQASK